MPFAPIEPGASTSLDSVNHREVFDQGVNTFSRMFTRWMDSNEWSHPNIVLLAKSALNGSAWLHSSQVAGLRHGTLKSPGPRTFVAIERLNFYLHRYKEHKILIPNTSSSNLYREPEVILDGDQPPTLGWWVEVFCGTRQPSHMELEEVFFTESQATKFSKGYGRLVRRLLAVNGLDIVTDLDVALHRHYTPGDTQRVTLIKEVLMNESVWTPDQLRLELPALSQLTAALHGPADEAALLAELT